MFVSDLCCVVMCLDLCKFKVHKIITLLHQWFFLLWFGQFHNRELQHNRHYYKQVCVILPLLIWMLKERGKSLSVGLKLRVRLPLYAFNNTDFFSRVILFGGYLFCKLVTEHRRCFVRHSGNQSEAFKTFKIDTHEKYNNKC